MKNLIRILLLVFFVLSLSACVPMSLGIHQIDVITKDETTNELKYVAIHKHGTRTIEQFESDEIKIYYAEHGCFTSYFKDNDFYSKLVRIALQDKDGNPIETNETIESIFKAADDHSSGIHEFQIIQVGEEYFALIKLNVNWSSPCNFYRYDKETQELKLLRTFDGVDVIGVRLRPDDKSKKQNSAS
ncbi:MAG: hypothetical protein Q4D65_02275 [Peptostreptococcaceae bacterium]|nr:hypothetical protein [Peptostreptococcaceae bacterium]